MSLLGTVRLGLSKPDIISLGDVFVGKPIRGKVIVKNRTSKALTITKVVTSCGCTAAYPRKSKIPGDSTSEVLIELIPKKVDVFGVKVTIQSDTGDFEFILKGRSLARIAPKSSELTYKKSDKFLDLQFDIKDPSVSAKDVKMSFNGIMLNKTHVAPQQVAFSIPVALVKPTAFSNLIPIIDGREESVIPMKILQAGSTRLITDQIYGSGDPYTFRLFITGDIQVKSGIEKASLQIADRHHPISMRIIAKKRSALVE